MSRALVGLLIVAAVAGSARSGFAKCANPRAAVGPPAGSTVPPNPTLYVFVPSIKATEAISVGSTAGPLDFGDEIVGTTPSFKAHKISVRSKDATRLWVTVGDSEWQRYEYVIDPAWRRPPPQASEIEGFTESKYEWTCSHEDAVGIKPTAIGAAYRLEWLSSEGKQTAVFPRSTSDFFWYGEADGPPPAPLIEIGFLNCFGDTNPTGLLFADSYGVAALHPDGSSDPPSKTYGHRLETRHVAQRTLDGVFASEAPSWMNFLRAILAGVVPGSALGYLLGRRRSTRSPR